MARDGRTWFALSLILSWSAVGAAQPAPRDFFGTWTLDAQDPRDTEAPKEIVIGEGELIEASPSRAPRRVIVTRQWSDKQLTVTYDTVIESGTVGGGGDPFNTVNTHRTVKWIDGALVIDEGRHTGPVAERGDWHEHQEYWVLEAVDTLRVRITTRGSQTQPHTTILRYRRK